MALAVALVATMAVTSCIDEEQPTDAATASQIEGSSSSLATLIDSTHRGEMDLDIAAAVLEAVGESLIRPLGQTFAHSPQLVHLL